jgi:pimeloyl-ACP methyl ester carboxylesterase
MRLSLDAIDMHFEDSEGGKDPLLLLHGLMGTGGDFQHVFDLAALRRDHRVIVPDLRGHGRTTNPTGTFSFRQCALDAVALLDRLGVERFAAIGTSLGAKTMLHVATAQPDRVAAMVLVSAAHRFPASTREVMRAAAAIEQPLQAWVEMRARHGQGDDQIRALWGLPRRFADDPADMAFTRESLGGVTARTLIVHGDRDPLYPVELALELHRAIPRASLWVVPDGGHLPIYGDDRPAFERVALAFLRGGRPGESASGSTNA